MSDVWCPDCKKFVEPTVETEPESWEDELELISGADPETVNWRTVLLCPCCGKELSRE